MKFRHSSAVSCVVFLFSTIWRLSGSAQTVHVCSSNEDNYFQSLSSSFHVLSREEQESLLLRHDQQLLEVAAKYGESVVVRLNETSQTAIVQEGVHIAMDCLPWVCRMGEGEGVIVHWLKRSLHVDPISGIVQSVDTHATNVEAVDGHIQVGGDRDRWLNITYTSLASADSDAHDHGEYICNVCRNKSVVSPVDCQSASLTLYVIGAPPVISKQTNSSEPSTVLSDVLVYDIGADFCLKRNSNTSVALRCNLLQTNHPRSLPKPIRSWYKDGDLLSRGKNISHEFFIERIHLILGVLSPSNFVLLGPDNNVLFLNTSVDSVTTPELLQDSDVTVDVARDQLFDLLLGEVSCSVENVYGIDMATSVIQECDTPSTKLTTDYYNMTMATSTSYNKKTRARTVDGKETEEISGPGCPSEVDPYYGIKWKSTPAASVTMEHCGNDSTAKRECDSSGTWLMPDVLECQKNSFADVLSQADEVFTSNFTGLPKLQLALNVTEELSLLTSPLDKSASIFPQDLNTTVYILEKTVDLLLEANKMAELKPTIHKSSTVLDVASNILDEINDVAIQTLQEEDPLFSQTLLNAIERYGFYVAQAETTSNVTINTENIAVKVETVDMAESRDVISVSFLSSPAQYPASIQLPISLLMKRTNRSVLPIANILIQNLQQYLPQTSLDNTTAPGYPASAILSSQVAISEESFEGLDEPVVMNFTVSTNSSKPQDLKCVFWDYTDNIASGGGWSTDNITTVVSATFEDKSTVTCSSTHLTSFAVLVNVAENRDELVSIIPLHYLSYIGLVLSLVCLLPTIIFFLTYGKQLLTEVHYFVHLNLSIALFFANLLFIAGAESATGVKIVCQIITGLLHYFYLAVFCWMLCEGVMLYLMLIVVFSVLSKKWWFFLLLGWLPPILFVSIGGGLSVKEKYAEERQYCWLSTNTAFWTFIIPMLAIMFVNAIFLVLIIITLCRKYKKKRHGKRKKGYQTALTAVKASVILLPLLGLTWVIGLFAVNTETVAFAYIFTGINSFQGVFVFVFHVLRNERIWGRIKKRCCPSRTTSSHVASVSHQMQYRTSIKSAKNNTQMTDVVTTLSSSSTLVLNSDTAGGDVARNDGEEHTKLSDTNGAQKQQP